MTANEGGLTPLRGPVVEQAPAKINLALAVTGRRADGYHLLDSFVVFGRICDVVRAWPDADLSLEICGPFSAGLETGRGNLVLRAATALAEQARRLGREVPGARISLTKVLPVAAGIGGGSADAAATLRALDRLWGLDLGPARLAEIGSGLGADVAMCVYSRALRAGGIGDALTMLDNLPSVPVLLANPRLEVSTARIFAARSGSFSPPLGDVADPATAVELARTLSAMANDLEAPARRLVPEIGDVLAALSRCRGSLLARMSGSGPTCFAIFADSAAAAAAATILSRLWPHWWIAATQAQ